jgi:hypothetical protein
MIVQAEGVRNDIIWAEMSGNGLKIYSLHQQQLAELCKTCDIVGHYCEIAGISTKCTADDGLVVCKNKTPKHTLDSFTA